MKKTCLFIAFLAATLIHCVAQSSAAKRVQQFNLDKTIAIQGYDPVAYFKQGKAVKGKKEFAVVADGINYYCSSAENKELFLKNITYYEPQYGGWCAFAMGNTGDKVQVDPATFKILDNKLYLFYNAFFTNTLKSWNRDEPNLRKKADANWAKFYHN